MIAFHPYDYWVLRFLLREQQLRKTADEVVYHFDVSLDPA